MVLLGGVLVTLILKGRRQEAQNAAAPTEIVKTARSTATRMMAPDDIDVSQSRVEIVSADKGSRKSASRRALCRLVVSNRGTIPYHDVMLRLSCLDRGGKVLDTLMQPVPETILPGKTLTVEDVSIEGVSAAAAGCRFAVVYASLGEAPAAEIPRGK